MWRLLSLIGLLCIVSLAGCGGGSSTSSNNGGSQSGGGTSVASISISPSRAIVRPNGTHAFIYQILANGTPNASVVWSADSGTIDNNGVYTANGSQPTATVTVRSVFDSTKSSSATVTVSDSAGPAFTVDTATRASLSRHFFQLDTNQTVDLGALIKVVGAANTAIQWSVDTPNGGTIDANGLYTAPSVLGTYRIRFSAAADPTQVDYVYALVAPLASGQVTGTISITPPQGANGPLQTLRVGALYRFGYAIKVQNSTDLSVTWTADNGGSIGSDGSFTAPRAGQYTITVISRATGQSSSVTVTAQ